MYCIDALAVALHCVYHTTNFSTAVARCVNIGGNACTTGAMVGAIAGVRGDSGQTRGRDTEREVTPRLPKAAPNAV